MKNDFYEPDYRDKCKKDPYLSDETKKNSCETRELIKNGSFETPDPTASDNILNTFADWAVTELNNVIVRAVNTTPSPQFTSRPTNEGQRALEFRSSGTTNDVEFKSAAISQNVFVTPGCFYRLEFAEDYFFRGLDAGITSRLIARVFYIKNLEQYDLINIKVAKTGGDFDIDKGYSFHEAVTEIAVPRDVTELTVQFRFTVSDVTGTEWLLDSVSLRAIKCETRELISNGSFEASTPIPEELFQDWTIDLLGSSNIQVTASNIAYEGTTAVNFITAASSERSTKTARLFQNVIVTPGCRYQLSFAENLLTRGTAPVGAPRPTLEARVYYVRASDEFDLINIPVVSSIYPNRGYAYHEAAAEISVPCDISGVTVEFIFREINDLGGNSWLVDAVSLRSVAPNPACEVCC